MSGEWQAHEEEPMAGTGEPGKAMNPADLEDLPDHPHGVDGPGVPIDQEDQKYLERSAKMRKIDHQRKKR